MLSVRLFILTLGSFLSLTAAFAGERLHHRLGRDISAKEAFSVLEAFDERLMSEFLEKGLPPPKQGLVECHRLTDFEIATVVCFYTNGRAMLRALDRASYYSEGRRGVPAGHVFPQRGSFDMRVGGYDQRGEDLITFFRKTDERCESDKRYCPNEQERAMSGFVSMLRERYGRFILVAVSVQAEASAALPSLHHELIHAQYYSDPRFRAAVARFWETLPAAERKRIREALSEYDTSNDEIMKKELAAYSLQIKAPPRFARYTKALREELTAYGTSPLAMPTPQRAWR